MHQRDPACQHDHATDRSLRECREGTLFICNANTLMGLFHTRTGLEREAVLRMLQNLVQLRDGEIKTGSAALANTAATKQEAAHRERDGYTIMVIDDDSIVRDLVACTMDNLGTVVKVAGAAEALETYQQVRPDVVFLDINMPGHNGLDVLDELMRLDPGACVVMLSGNSTVHNAKAARKRGAKGFIAKPFTKIAMQERFNHCLAARVQK